MAAMTANTNDTHLGVNDLRAYQRTEEIIINEMIQHGLSTDSSTRATRRLLRRLSEEGITLAVPASVVERDPAR